MRKISDRFLKDLDTGILSAVTNAVKASNGKLILCFRENYINVYRKSHSLFKIEEQRVHKYKVTFNLGHARYMKTKDQIRAELQAIWPGIRVSDGKSNNAYFYISPAHTPPVAHIVDAYSVYIDHFFAAAALYKSAPLYDYFKGEQATPPKGLLEKKRQHEIYVDYNTISTGKPLGELVFYDMELSLPRELFDDLPDDDVIKGSPDCLAAKVENGTITGIVLVEVKSNESACEGQHGIEKHSRDFRDILCSDKLKRELYQMMKFVLEVNDQLGINLNKAKCVCDFNSCQFEILYLFTDNAIDWTNDIRKKNKNYMRYQAICSNAANASLETVEMLEMK